MADSDEKWLKRTKRDFDRSVDNLDAATLSQLNRRRHAAIEAAGRRKVQWSTWVPASGVAAAVLVAVLIAQGPGMDDLPVDDAATTDLLLLLGNEDIDMLEELEFYSWLDSEELMEIDDVG